MLTHKLRSAVTVVAAIGGLAGPLAANAAADNNNHGFDRSGEAWKQQTGGNLCGDYLLFYNSAINTMHNAIAAGDYVASFRSQDEAAGERMTARAAGCGWAWT